MNKQIIHKHCALGFLISRTAFVLEAREFSGPNSQVFSRLKSFKENLYISLKKEKLFKNYEINVVLLHQSNALANKK